MFYRVLQIVVDPLVAYNTSITFKYYTNWGPLTTSSLPTQNCQRFLLGELELEQRKVLEELAEQEKVRVPDGSWNCQDWIKSLLAAAVERRVLEANKVEEVLRCARE